MRFWRLIRPEGDVKLVNEVNGFLLHNLDENMLGYDLLWESRA
jgi:hypothetical protein